MNFDLIRSQVGTYETEADKSVVSAQLQTIIANHSFEIFRDTERLAAEIGSLQISKTVKAQLVLILSCSTLPDFILNSKSDLNLVDVDNVVHNVVQTTGLSYQCALRLITDVFYACGLSFPVEYGPQISETASLNSGNLIEYKLHAMMPSEMAEAEIKSTEKLIAESSSDAVAAIHKLCSAGISKGFYLLGRCYLYGECGTDIDYSKAAELMKIAAKQGIAEAAADLGDIYYNSENILLRNYTLAHHYYTRPGAIAVSKERQKALRDIYRQHSANKKTLVFSGVVFALTIIFLVFFNTGIFSGSSRFVIGVIFTVLSGLVCAGGVYFNIIAKYNSLRWIIAAQFFVWSIYAFILVLA